jgi:hypothetical protein
MAVSDDDGDPGRATAKHLARAHASLLRLRPLYDRLTAAHSDWTAILAEAGRELEAAGDDAGLAVLRREFPPIGGDPRLTADAELGAIGRALAALVPDLRPPADLDEARRCLGRVAEVLAAYAAVTVARRPAPRLGDRDPLRAAPTAQALLRALLDWRDERTDGGELVDALTAALSGRDRA